MKRRFIKGLIMTFLLTLTISTPTFAWDSREDVNTMDTHKTISVQALELIKNDVKLTDKQSEAINIIQENIKQYKAGSVAPDFGETDKGRDYRLYQDHFFDADDGTNFTSSTLYPLYAINDNAESQTVNYIGQAVAAWKDGDFPKSTYLLGKGLHYFEDLNEPHHALNWVAGMSLHTQFEGYVEENKNDFKISTVGEDKDSYNDYKEEDFYKFLSLQSVKYSKKAKKYKNMVTLSNSWDEWRKAASETMKNVQIGTASVVYRFLKEVSEEKNLKLQNPIGRIYVIIRTDDVKDAGTDDYMYFGLGFSDGKKLENNCDVAGDDFTRASIRPYQFTINSSEYDINKLNKIWIRKERFLGDDWKGEEIELYAQGQRIFKGKIGRWLSGNDIIEFPIEI